jgi:hypothetical protein
LAKHFEKHFLGMPMRWNRYAGVFFKIKNPFSIFRSLVFQSMDTLKSELISQVFTPFGPREKP